MSDYYKILEKIERILTQYAMLFQRLFPKLGSQAHFIAIHESVDNESHRGKQVENKELQFQEVAKGKYARTRIWLTM